MGNKTHIAYRLLHGTTTLANEFDAILNTGTIFSGVVEPSAVNLNPDPSLTNSDTWFVFSGGTLVLPFVTGEITWKSHIVPGNGITGFVGISQTEWPLFKDSFADGVALRITCDVVIVEDTGSGGVPTLACYAKADAVSNTVSLTGDGNYEVTVPAVDAFNAGYGGAMFLAPTRVKTVGRTQLKFSNIQIFAE